MTTKTRIRSAVLAALAFAIIVPVVAYGRDSAGPRTERRVEALVSLGTSFTFQGRLTDAGVPANGVYDLNFYLYDALAGGSQVGPVQTAGDVAVSAGLFTVTLNFGDIFHGAQYFLDIQVRPGASTGAYTILTPREPISAVPNASFAAEAASATGLQGVNISTTAPANGDVLKFDGTKWTPSASGGGSFALPFAASQSFAGGLLKITNTSTGANAAAIVAESSSTAVGASALEVAGPIKVSGSKPAAFEHQALAASISGDTTVITNPATDGNPTALLFVAQVFGVNNPHPIGVYYDGSKWRIRNSDFAAMALNAKFNVLVINQ